MVTALAWSQEYMNPRPGNNQDMRVAAVLRCANNEKHMMKIPIGAFGGNPQAIAKLFQRAGWEVDQHNKSKCFCPTCVKSSRRSRESVTVRRLPPINQKPTEELEKMTKPIDLTNAHPTVDVRTIPSDVKMKIRNRLDENFDDEKGVYLAGYSDEKIATELDIPRSQVFAYREMAYGPLKSDPEVDAIMAALVDLRSQLANIQSELAKVELKAQACLKRLGL